MERQADRRMRVRRNGDREIKTKKIFGFEFLVLLWFDTLWNVYEHFTVIKPVSKFFKWKKDSILLQTESELPTNLDNKSSICSQLPKLIKKIEIKQEMNNQKVNWRCNFCKLSEQNRELVINRGHRASLSAGICKCTNILQYKEIVVKWINTWTLLHFSILNFHCSFFFVVFSMCVRLVVWSCASHQFSLFA